MEEVALPAARPKRQPKTAFTVSIRVSGVSSALIAPRFRFALPFGNGTKATRVVTEPIASWKRVAAGDRSNSASTSDGSGGADDGGEDVDSGVGAVNGDAPTAEDASTDDALYEWRESYTHECDAEWAIGVNEQPFVMVHLGDATSNVLGHARLDISPLLASGTAADTRELGFVGNRFGAIAAARAAGIGVLEPTNAEAARLGGKSVAVALVAGLVGPGGPFAEPELVRNSLLRSIIVRIETSQAALPPAVQFELNPLVVTLRRSHPLPAPPSESIATHNDSDAAASAAAGSLALVVAGAVVERPVDDVANAAADEGAAEGNETRATKAQPSCYVSVTFGTRASFCTTASVATTERVGGAAAAQGGAAVALGDAATAEESDGADEEVVEAAAGVGKAADEALRCTHSFAPLSGSAAEASALHLVYGDAAAPEQLVVLVELFENVAKERGARRGARARSSGSVSPRGGRSPRSALRGKLIASATISVVKWINRGVSSETVELVVESSLATLVKAARVSLRAQWQSPLVYAAFHLPMRGMAPGTEEGEADSKAAGHGAHGAATAGNEPRLSQAPRWTAGVAVSLDAREKTWFASWNHTLCVLTGPSVVEQHRIRKHLDTARIALTVHDRDMQETAEHLEEQRARWAALASASSSVDDDAAWEQQDAVRAEEEAEAEHGCMGSKHPHGAASTRFSELLLRNREIAAGFDRTRATLRRKRAAGVATDDAVAAGGGVETSDPWVDAADVDEDEEDALLRLASEASIDACVVPCRARSTERLSEKVELRVPAPPGCYLESSTSLVGLARLFRSVDAADNPFKRPAQPLFERMIISFMYDNTEILHTILRVVREVNQAALPDVSLRSYQLSAAEKALAQAGELDIIGGFMICDAERRLIVLEGLSARGVHALNAALPRTIANDTSTHFLRDPTIRFTKRLYTAFEVDVKVIRLRTTLYTVMTMPRNYNTNNVDAELFAALHSMLNAQKARTMREVCAANLFPTAHALAEVESKYGETVTLLDMGIVHNKRRRDFTLSGKLQQFATAAADELDATFLRLPSRGELFDATDAVGVPATTQAGGETQAVGSDSLVKLASKIANVKKGVALFKKGVAAHGASLPAVTGAGATHGAPAKRKAPTDATNEAFEEYLRQRKHIVPPDRIGNALRKSSALKRAAANMMVSKQRAAEKQWEEEGPYYQYSGQRLRTLDAEKEKMRLRIAKDLGSTCVVSFFSPHRSAMVFYARSAVSFAHAVCYLALCRTFLSHPLSPLSTHSRVQVHILEGRRFRFSHCLTLRP